MTSLTLRKRGRPKSPERAELRRGQILDVAADIFARDGYPKTDVQAIADRLGLGKGTIYRYFKSKQDLFLAAVDQGMQELTDFIHSKADLFDDPIDRIRVAVEAYLEHHGAHPELIELIIQERAEFKDRKKPTYLVHRDANVKPWQESIREMIRAKRIRDIPVERITNTLSDLLYGTTFTNHFSGGGKSVKEQARDIIDVTFNGILTESEARDQAVRTAKAARGKGK